MPKPHTNKLLPHVMWQPFLLKQHKPDESAIDSVAFKNVEAHPTQVSFGSSPSGSANPSCWFFPEV
jgi:hypothetical protein